MRVWSTDNRPMGLTEYDDRLLVAEEGHGVVSYTLGGKDKRTSVTWSSTQDYGDIASVAVQGDNLAVVGRKGIRMYQLPGDQLS